MRDVLHALNGVQGSGAYGILKGNRISLGQTSSVIIDGLEVSQEKRRLLGGLPETRVMVIYRGPLFEKLYVRVSGRA